MIKYFAETKEGRIFEAKEIRNTWGNGEGVHLNRIRPHHFPDSSIHTLSQYAELVPDEYFLKCICGYPMFFLSEIALGWGLGASRDLSPKGAFLRDIIYIWYEESD